MIFSDEIFHTLFPGTGDTAAHQMVRLSDWPALLPCPFVKTDLSSQNPSLSFLSSLVMFISRRQIQNKTSQQRFLYEPYRDGKGMAGGGFSVG